MVLHAGQPFPLAIDISDRLVCAINTRNTHNPKQIRRPVPFSITHDNSDLKAIQQREGRWVISDLKGKGGRVRTVAIPMWVKQGIDAWTVAANLESGRLLRPVLKSGRILGERLGCLERGPNFSQRDRYRALRCT